MTIHPKTAVEAFNSNTHSIVKLKKELDNEIVLNAFLAFAVTELVESFNIGKTMNAMQVAFAVETIKTDYYFLKIEELKFCFLEAKKGRYGTMYDRIDCAIICEWIEKYLTQRVQLAYDKNHNEHKQLKPTDIHPKITSMMQTLIESVDPVNMDLVTPKRRELTEQEIIIQDILKEFDSLPEIPGSIAAMKIIDYNGKKLTQSEYLEERLGEINK